MRTSPGDVGFSLRDGDGNSLVDDSLDQPIAALQRLVSNDVGEFRPDGGSLSFRQDRLIQFLEFSIDSIEVEILDSDGDGVLDENDVCPGTIVPDPVIPISGELSTNRYALIDTDTTFDTTRLRTTVPSTHWPTRAAATPPRSPTHSDWASPTTRKASPGQCSNPGLRA